MLLCAATLAMRLSIVASPCVDAPRSHCKALCMPPRRTALQMPQSLVPTPTSVLIGVILTAAIVGSWLLSVMRYVLPGTGRLPIRLPARPQHHPVLPSRASRTPTTQVISPSKRTWAVPLSSLAASLRCQAARRSTKPSGRTVLSSMSLTTGGKPQPHESSSHPPCIKALHPLFKATIRLSDTAHIMPARSLAYLPEVAEGCSLQSMSCTCLASSIASLQPCSKLHSVHLAQLGVQSRLKQY